MIRQEGEETVEQPVIQLTNVLTKFSYPQEQLDSRKVNVLLNFTKYFDIKW